MFYSRENPAAKDSTSQIQQYNGIKNLHQGKLNQSLSTIGDDGKQAGEGTEPPLLFQIVYHCFLHVYIKELRMHLICCSGILSQKVSIDHIVWRNKKLHGTTGLHKRRLHTCAKSSILQLWQY